MEESISDRSGEHPSVETGRKAECVGADAGKSMHVEGTYGGSFRISSAFLVEEEARSSSEKQDKGIKRERRYRNSPLGDQEIEQTRKL